jgi:hypothetical protein
MMRFTRPQIQNVLLVTLSAAILPLTQPLNFPQLSGQRVRLAERELKRGSCIMFRASATRISDYLNSCRALADLAEYLSFSI